MEQPIIVCGLGRMGWRVLDLLQAAMMPVVVVDDKCRADEPGLKGTRLIVGDFRRREILEEAGIRQARGVLLLTGDDLLNITVALTIRSLNPDVRIVLRMFNQNLLERLGQTVKNVFALSTSLLTAPILAVTALTGKGLGAVSISDSDTKRQMAELQISSGSILCGRSIRSSLGQREAQVLAYFPSAGAPQFLLEVEAETILAAGDRLVVCGEAATLETLVNESNPAGGGHLLWAGRLRRLGRIITLTFAEMDKAVLICSLVLIAVLCVSTLALHLGHSRLSVAEALYRTVSIMATGASLGAEGYTGWLKVFVAFLRIIGAALLAAFTAIVTNYLLRARLGGALEVRRIPESGHFVVCGLSPIGFRVVEELIGYGQRVVVIECTQDNRFVVTARRLGVAVIIGDATIPDVLRQSHAATARAVIVTTNQDLVNLEVALLVREQNNKQRVVLLQSDPNLAQMLREGAGIRLAFSPPTLAAPAFVAGLFGDRVQSLFVIGDKIFAVIDLKTILGDLLIGQSLRALAIDYQLLPVALLPNDGPRPKNLLQARVGQGDRLIAILALTDLQRLLQRRPSSAAFEVEATSCPLPMRGWLAGLVRLTRGLTAEDAEKFPEQLPALVGSGLTRGQAEDLLAQLARERVGARLRELVG